MQVSSPNSPPIKRYCQNSIPYVSQVISTKNGENGISAMPRSILRISIWKFNLVFGPHVQTNWKPAIVFFSRQAMVASFFRIVISVISLGKKKKKLKRPAFSFVGWCMINIVSKNHTQTRKLERDMDNPPLWQWLGWPSSYSAYVALVWKNLRAWGDPRKQVCQEIGPSLGERRSFFGP